MKVEKFKVLLYLKKSGTDKSGKAPIMGRITVNRTMAQFGCKLSCKPELWNTRESRLDGKSREAVETNAKLDKLLLAVNAAFDTLMERGQEFDATAVKDLFQGSMKTQMTQQEMSDAFNVFGCDIRKAVHAIYKNGELLESETKRYIKQDNGINYDVYSLEMVIAVSFKLRSRESVAFGRFIMGRLTMNNRQPVNIFFSLSPSRGKRAGN